MLIEIVQSLILPINPDVRKAAALLYGRIKLPIGTSVSLPFNNTPAVGDEVQESVSTLPVVTSMIGLFVSEVAEFCT